MIQPAQSSLRSPEIVMRLERMGAAYPTRLSFMRILLRRLSAEKAQVTRPVWQIDDQGFGRAVYAVNLGGNTYSLVAFATALAPENRTDRVIAEAWDASFVLFDGVPDAADLDRLQANAPKQEAGRFTARELVISRANKSVRLFEHVVDRLANGRQPDGSNIGSIGYLMRTTAVYGNGKFGFADRFRIAERPALAAPFQAEMLTVWLIRGFTHDLVEHIAKARNPKNHVMLDAAIKRDLGIGNSTGLGMAPFLMKHSVLLNNWMRARETAIARVRAVKNADQTAIKRVVALLKRAQTHVDQWSVLDQRQMDRIIVLRKELAQIVRLITPNWLHEANPWDRLLVQSADYSIECQELLCALILEPYGHLVDNLADDMADKIGASLDPRMSISELSELLQGQYQWALDVDFSKPDASHYFWYTSEEKLEPRLGVRREEPGAELEMAVDIARQAKALFRDLTKLDQASSLAWFLLDHPQHRHMIRRVQTSKDHAYSEIRDNLIGVECMPLDILRCKLSFFGASKCDPKSSLWTRINMYQGAPLSGDIGGENTDDWWLPIVGGQQ